MDVFTSGSGRKFEIVPEYYEAHRGPFEARFLDNPDTELAFDQDRAVLRTLSKSAANSDARTFVYFLESLRAAGKLDSTWPRHLDIGGAGGNHCALVKSGGLVSDTTSIDILAYENSTAKRQSYLNSLKRKILRRKLGMRTNFVNPNNKFGLKEDALDTLSHISFRQSPAVDRMLTSDLFELEEKFDLVTGFLCIEYFNLQKLFEKVASLLNSGGFFYFIVNCWWYPVNSTGLVTDIPYAMQRMTADEFQEYTEYRFPELSGRMMRRYRYFHQGEHPTEDDYVSVANESGMQIVNSTRITPDVDSSTRTSFPPRKLAKIDGFSFAHVAEQVCETGSSATLLDLHTGWMSMLFRRA